ncbi:uncharacterized protein LOC128201722 [Galleria mellonella]|uniref:Uncharacterized protein LOC128201722 n=2 Tax=Galleria mellonella TaxID=7137 RepID=A0ABM3MVK9_GALME|nr:uncharacterized protein LOC128201722 [Galleria mellonella]
MCKGAVYRSLSIMATNILKCNNCNIVISELLSFVQNKCDVMDEESLIRIVTTSFSSEEIREAKTLLFDSVNTKIRKIMRKKDGKEKRDIEDILSLLKGIDPEKIPIFVARNLQKLPPISFDHVDVTKLLKDILVLQQEVRTVKETCATTEELQLIKNELANLKSASIVNNFEPSQYINTKRGCANVIDNFHYDSGPIGLLHISQEEKNGNINSECNINIPSKTQSNCLINSTLENVSARVEDTVHQCKQNIAADTQVSATGVNIANSHNTVSHPLVVEKSFADIASGGKWKNGKKSEDWIVVQRKKLRNRFMGKRGQASTEPEEKFRAADVKIPLFINKVDKNTSIEDISSYILQKTKVSVALEKICMKFQKEYDAYKIFVPQSKLSIFMDAGLWPDGISFRRFVTFKKTSGNDDKFLNTK